MTSSSSTSGSGSLSSQSVPSSMDSTGTLPTQDCVDGNWSENEDVDESIWGKLYPVGKGFNLLDLKKESYQFGRDVDLDVTFISKDFPKSSFFLSLSKRHFELFKEKSDCAKTGEHVVYIKDWSSNGTFVNGEKIGKGNKQVILNNDEIQLAKNRAYVFVDLVTINQETESIPREIKKKYTLSRVLGRGACGEVRLAFGRGKECGKFAVKIISKRTFATSDNVGRNINNNVSEEAEIMKKLNHPCIVEVIDVFDSPESLYIFLELVEGGELFERVLSSGRLKEPTAKLIFYQILVAVKYLHDKGFTHRDLKPENVLLCSRDSNDTLIKITDFGLSKFVGEESLMKTLCGTPSYLAPEVVQDEGARGYKKECDCWSLGVVLYVCLGGYHPFCDQPTKSVKEQILEGAYSFPEHKWGIVSSEAKDLIKKLLTVNPKERLSITKALEHPWMQDEDIIKKAKDLMTKTDQRKDETMPPPSQSVAKRKEQPDNAPAMKRQKSEEY